MNDHSERDGWLALSYEVGTLDPKFIHPGLIQALHRHAHVGADLCVTGLERLLVLPLLLHKVADNWAAAIITWGFPGQCDGVLGALCVVELLRV